MDFKELTYILCIAKHQSISKAANELYLSQPTLSKFLKKIEYEIGTQLFHHINNQFTPTYVGERYLEYANRIMSIKRNWDEEFYKLMSLDNGQLTIAFPLLRSYCTIPDTLPIFKKKYPNIQVNVLEETYDVEGKLLNDDKIDLAIFNGQAQNPKLEYQVLGSDETLLITSQSHPLARSGKIVSGCKYPWIDLKLFGNDNFILFDSNLHTGQVSMQLLDEAGITPKVVFRTRNVELQAQMAAEGLGVCFITESYLKHIKFKHQPNCFSIGNPRIVSSLVLAYRKGAYLTPYALDYIKIVTEYFSRHGL